MKAFDPSLKWRGLLLAAAFRAGMSWLEPPESLQETLRRGVAVSLDITSSSIVRLQLASQFEKGVEASTVEWELEVDLKAAMLDRDEVLDSLVALSDKSSLVGLLFRNSLKGYASINVLWVDILMLPVAYNGSVFNVTGDIFEVPSGGDTEADNSALVSGVLLAFVAIPVVASITQFLIVDRRVRRASIPSPSSRAA